MINTLCVRCRPVASRRFAGIGLCLVILVSCHDSDGRRRRGTGAGANRAPSASLAVSGDRRPGSQILFDGSGSSDPDGDPLTLDWELVAKPDQSAVSTANLHFPEPAMAMLVPDVVGGYRVRLTVSDGKLMAVTSALVLIEAKDGNGNGNGHDPGNVDLICPSRGYLRGGDEVTLFGGTFPADVRVLFGANPGLDVRIEAEGSRIVVKTPPASTPGPADVTVVVGDQAFDFAGAFTYLPGPLEFATNEKRDLSLGRSVFSLLGIGAGRVLAGLGDGQAQILLPAPGGGLLPGPVIDVARSGKIVQLRAGRSGADGSLEVGALRSEGQAPSILRISRANDVQVFHLDLEAIAVDLAFVDADGAGKNEVFVADRENRRVVIYAVVAESGGERYEPIKDDLSTEGEPCAIAAAELDGDADREVVVVCFPGPEITVIDFAPLGPRVSHRDLPGIDGIAQLAPGRLSGGNLDEFVALTITKRAPPAANLNSIRFFAPRTDQGGGGISFFEPFPRFDIADGKQDLKIADLDLDGDIDAVAFDGASGSALVLVNTRVDGPQTSEACEEILRGGQEPAATAFRLVRVPLFSSAGILTIAPADVDSDGLPELVGSHEEELHGVRVLPNRTGK